MLELWNGNAERKALTFNFDVSGSSLWLAYAIGDFTRIKTAIVRVNGADYQGAISLEQSARFEPRDRADGVVFTVPSDGKVTGKATSLARHFQLVTFQPRHIQRGNNDHGSTCKRQKQ